MASWYAPPRSRTRAPLAHTVRRHQFLNEPGYSGSSSVLEKPSSRWIPPSISPLRKRARASTAFHQGHTLTFWSLCASTCVIGGVIVTDPTVRQFVCRTVASTRCTRSCGATPLSTASVLPSDEERSSASPPSERLLYSPAASFQRWALMPSRIAAARDRVAVPPPGRPASARSWQSVEADPQRARSSRERARRPETEGIGMIHPLRHVDEESSLIGITIDPRIDPGTQRGRRVGQKLSIPHEKVVTPDGARQPGHALRRAALGRIFRDFEPRGLAIACRCRS